MTKRNCSQFTCRHNMGLFSLTLSLESILETETFRLFRLNSRLCISCILEISLLTAGQEELSSRLGTLHSLVSTIVDNTLDSPFRLAPAFGIRRQMNWKQRERNHMLIICIHDNLFGSVRETREIPLQAFRRAKDDDVLSNLNF